MHRTSAFIETGILLGVLVGAFYGLGWLIGDTGSDPTICVAIYALYRAVLADTK